MALKDSTRDNILKDLTDPPEVVAAEAGLRYVCDTQPGYYRKKRGKGFIYVDYTGKRLTDDVHLKRIRALVIPPAWSDVWICKIANGHIQCTGRDAKGRKQYRYHMEWARVRNQNKYEKLLAFGAKLPQIRKRVEEDLAKPGMCREKVLAAIVRIMEKTMIRIGNEEYADKNKSYGLTTIRNNHVKVQGSTIKFRFRGKSGIQHEIDLRDPQLARIVRKCQDLPGQELFGYEADDGTVFDVESGDVNDYLREISGDAFSAKDFRTWGGTVRAAIKLKELGPAPSKKHVKRSLLSAIQATAEHLGNTPTVCKKYYIHPCLFNAFEKGSLFEIGQCRKKRLRRVRGLHPAEREVMHLIAEAVG